MNRARRILTRGWLGKALSALTFGYYPYRDVTIPSDWCIDDNVLHDWSTSNVALCGWDVVSQKQNEWITTSAAVLDWSIIVELETVALDACIEEEEIDQDGDEVLCDWSIDAALAVDFSITDAPQYSWALDDVAPAFVLDSAIRYGWVTSISRRECE